MTPLPDQPDLSWSLSAHTKRVKALKRAVARAERIRRQGLSPRDVPCPHCGAPAFLSLKRDYECRSGTGPYWRMHRPHGGYHKKRHEAATRLKERILSDGEEAGRYLGRGHKP